ncbi:MAG: class SAM-dependent methyltransferase [Marmoricola sp.]|jgi:SAM-dependent methyltransferase|nr:class SAM-dependent methyltransferase [Marmoricola sp.]
MSERSSERWSAEFWDERYRSKPSLWSGNANAVVMAETAGLTPGRALDVGCGEGGDALWLATQGWQVDGVDVSRVALDRAAGHAAAAGGEIASRTRWEQRDLLAWTPPASSYDLVSVPFLHLPSATRVPVYAGLAAAVAPGGTFLVVAHHPSDLGVVPRPPEPDLFFTAEELAAELDDGWRVVTREARSRPGTHPDGYEVLLHDTVLRATR